MRSSTAIPETCSETRVDSHAPASTQTHTPPARVRGSRSTRLVWVALGLAAALGGGGPRLARAQSAVSVEVRTPASAPAEGRVSLTPEGAAAPTHSCQTRDGVCTMAGVPGGRYVVRLAQADGSEAPEPRVVVIPPSGSVTLRVSTH